MSRLGGDDFSMMEKECARHLQSVARDVAHAAAFENGKRSWPPHSRAEEFHEATFAQTEGAVELAARVGDAGDTAAFSQILGLFTVLEHVDQHQLGALCLCFSVKILQTAQNLARKGAAEMSQKNQRELLIV